MKKLTTMLLALTTVFLLNGCGEWDNMVDSITGSDDDDDTTVQAEAPRKEVPQTKTTTSTDTGTTTGTDKETKTEDGYKNQATFTSYGVRNGGRQAWRISKKGPEFGKKIKVVFSDGHTVLVKDTSHNYRESDGFVFKPGIGPNGEGDSNTGTAHGGVYLHAPYGNRSTRVTFHY